jgi:hypothetical protein
MKNFIFLFTLALFGLSLNLNAQEEFQVLKKSEIQELIEIYGEPIESFDVKSGERDSRVPVEWETVMANLRNGLSGCSFDFRFHKFCTFTVLEVVNCPDCVGYLWSTGATTNYIVINSTGNYRVTVDGSSPTDGACTSTANSTIDQIGTPVPVSISGNTSFCEGGNTILTASGSGDFCWNTGAKTAMLSVTSAGTYTVTVTNANGCTGTASKTVTMSPAPASPLVTETVNPVTGVITLTSSAFSGNVWSNGATTQSINPTTSGIYTVSVRNSAGCLSQSSCESKVIVSIKTVYETIHETIFVDTCLDNHGSVGLSFNAYVEWGKVTFVVNTPNPNPYISYYWNFGDNTTGGGFNTVHYYGQAGTYLVKLRAYYQNQNGTASYHEVSQYVYIYESAQPCNRVGLTIKGQTDGAIFPQSQINSQTRVNAPNLPTGAHSWQWSTGNVHQYWTVVQTSGATVGPHEMFFRYKVGVQNFCHVIRYTVVPGYGIMDNDTDNKYSSSEEDEMHPSEIMMDETIFEDQEIETRNNADYLTNGQYLPTYPLDKESVNAFPNPTTGRFDLDLTGHPNQMYFISITDQLGNVITKKIVKIE